MSVWIHLEWSCTSSLYTFFLWGLYTKICSGYIHGQHIQYTASGGEGNLTSLFFSLSACVSVCVWLQTVYSPDSFSKLEVDICTVCKGRNETTSFSAQYRSFAILHSTLFTIGSDSSVNKRGKNTHTFIHSFNISQGQRWNSMFADIYLWKFMQLPLKSSFRQSPSTHLPMREREITAPKGVCVCVREKKNVPVAWCCVSGLCWASVGLNQHGRAPGIKANGENKSQPLFPTCRAASSGLSVYTACTKSTIAPSNTSFIEAFWPWMYSRGRARGLNKPREYCQDSLLCSALFSTMAITLWKSF